MMGCHYQQGGLWQVIGLIFFLGFGAPRSMTQQRTYRMKQTFVVLHFATIDIESQYREVVEKPSRNPSQSHALPHAACHTLH